MRAGKPGDHAVPLLPIDDGRGPLQPRREPRGQLAHTFCARARLLRAPGKRISPQVVLIGVGGKLSY